MQSIITFNSINSEPLQEPVFNKLRVAFKKTEPVPVVKLNPKKLIRITTVPMALKYLLPGQMKFMKENGYDVLMVSANGKELADVIAHEKCRHKIVPFTRKITPLQDLKCLYQLVKLFRKEKPNIVHTHTPKAGLLGMLAAKICGVKTRIHTVAGLPMMVENGAKFKLLKCIEKITYMAASNVWPNSASLKEYIVAHKLANPSKLDIIGKGSSNGINLNRFNTSGLMLNKIATTELQIKFSKQNTYLLFMGRLVKDKGIVELIEAFAQLQPMYPHLRLILAGEFENTLDPLPQDTISAITNNPAVIHISWTNDVEYFMHLADAFVFPSHREGFPNVLLQAAAMKLPVICSKIAGNVDIVQNKKTGLLFNTGNVTELIEAIEYSLTQKKQMIEMAADLQKIIFSDYQHTAIWQKILQQYTLLQAYKKTVTVATPQKNHPFIERCRQLASQLLHPGYNMENQLSSE
jgi:glycosyltransferase involved in cell wall biosynthesis